MLSGIRTIIMRRGTSVSRTVSLTLQSKATITSASFDNPDVYSRQPDTRKQAVETVIKFSATCGVDAAGAETAEIPGGFHSGGRGSDTHERLTVVYKDKDNQIMYFYRKSDGTFWERIHVPRDTPENAGFWNQDDDYICITEEDFKKRKAPQL